jgi:hypothetical protein
MELETDPTHCRGWCVRALREAARRPWDSGPLSQTAQSQPPAPAAPTTRSGHGARVTDRPLCVVSAKIVGTEGDKDVRCCGSPYQKITVQAGAGALALLRCTSCGDQQWARNGEAVQRTEAFDLLASAYREVPLRARAARDRAASVSAARQAARVAERATASAPLVTTGRPDAGTLMSLLDGWQVLGQTA